MDGGSKKNRWGGDIKKAHRGMIDGWRGLSRRMLSVGGRREVTALWWEPGSSVKNVSYGVLEKKSLGSGGKKFALWLFYLC